MSEKYFELFKISTRASENLTQNHQLNQRKQRDLSANQRNGKERRW